MNSWYRPRRRPSGQRSRRDAVVHWQLLASLLAALVCSIGPVPWMAPGLTTGPTHSAAAGSGVATNATGTTNPHPGLAAKP